MLHDWSLDTRWFIAMSCILIGVLLFCRNEVGLFYCPNQLGSLWWWCNEHIQRILDRAEFEFGFPFSRFVTRKRFEIHILRQNEILPFKIGPLNCYAKYNSIKNEALSSRFGWKVRMMTSYLLLIIFDQWDPSTTTSMWKVFANAAVFKRRKKITNKIFWIFGHFFNLSSSADKDF